MLCSKHKCNLSPRSLSLISLSQHNYYNLSPRSLSLKSLSSISLNTSTINLSLCYTIKRRSIDIVATEIELVSFIQELCWLRFIYSGDLGPQYDSFIPQNICSLNLRFYPFGFCANSCVNRG